MLRYTSGINGYDTSWINGVCTYVPPQQIATDWPDYIARLRKYAAMPRHPDEKDRKQVPWTSPMLLVPGARRERHNITGSSNFVSVDLDVAGWTLEMLNERFDGFARCFYTTTKSRPEWQRWRILLLLDREITVQWDEASQSWTGEYVSIWHFMNEALNSDLDIKTRNANRILYVPARWHGADNIFAVFDGEPLPVDSVLELCPVVAPQPVVIQPYDLKSAPDGTDILTPKMIEAFLSAPIGGRYWKLLTSAAARFRLQGWELSPADLHHAAMAAVGHLGDRHDAMREAARAIEWAARNVQPTTPMQRMRDRLRYERSKRIARL
jgi:hypothetical protein